MIHQSAAQRPAVTSCSGVRLNMQQMGLYQRFPRNTEVLLEYKRYLMDLLEVPNCQQEIDNVSRVLRFMQPCGNNVHMDFLNKSTETKDFIEALRKAGLLPSTILSYLNNMIRFVGFLMTRDLQDLDFMRSCSSYIQLLETLKKPVSESLSKTRSDRLIKGHRSVAECQKLLREAKKDMLGVFHHLQEDKLVSTENKTLFRYYCEAILMLGHFQRPGVVQGMSVKEWLNKTHVKNRVCVDVCEHRRVTFALTMEETSMLDAYYLWVRPENVQKEVADEGRFFISHSGRPVRSATSDLARLHAHYKLPNVTSQEIRRAIETEVLKSFGEEQRIQALYYMGYSTPLANTRYCVKSQEGVAATASTLSSSAGYSSDESVGVRGQKRSRDTDEEEKDFADFVEVFPVSLTGRPPLKRQRTDAGFPADRFFYDQWRAAQFGKREQHLLSKCHRRPPTARKVDKMIKREGWTSNHPRSEDVVSKWRPPKKGDVETDPHIMKRIRKQNWSGLSVRDFGDKRGQRAVATRSFPKGSIICDYHGKLITSEEGRRLLEDSSDEMGYLFFFSSGSQQLCIDARTSPCECHPLMETTLGRNLHHSRKKHNVKPFQCQMKFPEGEKETILLVAAKDIQVNEELRFNYGANGKSSLGEGLNLGWLDE